MSFFNGLIVAREQTIGGTGTPYTTPTTVAETVSVGSFRKRKPKPWLNVVKQWLELKVHG